MSIWWSLHLRREAASVPLARRLLLGTMETAGVDPDISYDLSVALTEACANAVEHAGSATGYRTCTARVPGDRPHREATACRIEVDRLRPRLLPRSASPTRLRLRPGAPPAPRPCAETRPRTLPDRGRCGPRPVPQQARAAARWSASTRSSSGATDAAAPGVLSRTRRGPATAGRGHARGRGRRISPRSPAIQASTSSALRGSAAERFRLPSSVTRMSSSIRTPMPRYSSGTVRSSAWK